MASPYFKYYLDFSKIVELLEIDHLLVPPFCNSSALGQITHAWGKYVVWFDTNDLTDLANEKSASHFYTIIYLCIEPVTKQFLLEAP